MPPPHGPALGRHRVDSRILVIFLILSSAMLIFLKLASEVLEGDTFAIDRKILAGLRSTADPSLPIGPAWLQGTMIDITALGGVSVLTLITVLTAGFLVAARKWTNAAFLLAATAGGAILSTVLKSVVARPRPGIVAHLVEVHTTSFPSGHAMNSAITYLTLGTLLARAEQSRPVRVYLLAVAVGLTLLIGSSRVYLGVHWPSDVVAGWCVGATWAAICSLTARELQRGRAIDPPTMLGQPRNGPRAVKNDRAL